MKTQYKLCILISLVITSYSGPIQQLSQTHNDESFAQAYLEKYYQVKQPAASIMRGRVDHMSEKIAEMQKYFGLVVTGTVNKETIQTMRKPRCGVPDVLQYSTYGPDVKWHRNHLTYNINTYTLDMSRDEVDNSIERALQVWASVTPLKFTRIDSDKADIMISFNVGEHGDFFPFDGPGSTLAHAFSPLHNGIGGDVHFDDDENFSFDSHNSFILFLVAAHEFGHSLGLYHSHDPNSIMFPAYNYRDPKDFILSADDVNGIQSLYGKNPAGDPIFATPSKPINDPDACDPNLVLDAVTTLRGEIMFFKDTFVWRGFPHSNAGKHPLKSYWPDIPSNVDAAYENPELDTVFFFKKRKVWAVSGYSVKEMDKGITYFGLPAKVASVTAALHDESSHKTLFFVGSYCYSYDEKRQKMDYPRLVEEVFPGMNEDVTAAYLKKGTIYLFSGPSVYEFSSRHRRLQHVYKINHFLKC